MRIAFLLLVSISLATAQALEVTDLRCEDLIAPIGVDLSQPSLSWRMEQAGGPRGQKQTAYQILVSSTTAKLAADDGDLWDSGQVFSGQSLRVSYAGAVLTSRQRCHWKVRAWAKDGSPSPWSTAAEWTMGLLNPADWTAKWIAHSASGLDGAQWIWSNEGNPASSAPVGTRQFRRTITLPGDRALVAAKVRLTADNSFSLTINGQSIATGTEWTQPVDADITAALQSGTNNIAISATNGGTTANPAGLIARFDFTFASGEPLTIVTDNTNFRTICK